MPNLLAGKLFDEAGEPLYVTGTTKGRRRYRYYVSRSLVTSPAKDTRDAWRLAAPEIERAVLVAAAQILEDQAALGTLLHEEAGLSAQPLATALKDIANWRTQLKAERAGIAAAAAVIDRVELGNNELHLTLNLAPLVDDNRIHVQLSIKRSVPMQLRRRGVESRIILRGEAAAMPTVDPALLKAVVRGQRWFNELAANLTKNISQIAKREGVHDSYVRRLLPLAFLAPAIVEMTCAGRQPPELTAERLTRGAKLPFDWAEQRKALASILAGSLPRS